MTDAPGCQKSLCAVICPHYRLRRNLAFYFFFLVFCLPLFWPVWAMDTLTPPTIAFFLCILTSPLPVTNCLVWRTQQP